MSNPKKNDAVNALDSLTNPADPSLGKDDVELPRMTPYARGTRINYSESLGVGLANLLVKEFQNKEGSVVIDFRGKGSITLPAVRALAQFAAKGLQPQQRELYLLRLPEDYVKTVKELGLGQILTMVTKSSQVPGLGDESTPKLDLNIINIFIASTVEALKVQCSVESTPGKPFLSNSQPAVFGDVIGLLNITSETFNGAIALVMPEKMFLHAMGKMVSETFTEITDDLKSGASELLNIIYGDAKMKLNQQGHKLSKLIPQVIQGQRISLSHRSSAPTLVVPFDTEAGYFFIEVGIYEPEEAT